MAVQLKNKRRGVVVFNLPHEQVCTETECLCTRQKVGVQDHNPETGAKSVRGFNRRLASSITLLAAGHEGATSKPLPNGVARLPEVLAAVDIGELEVIRLDAEGKPVRSEPEAGPDEKRPSIHPEITDKSEGDHA